MQPEATAEIIDPNHHLVMQGRRHFREVINSGGRIAKRLQDPSQDGALSVALQLALQTMAADEYTPSAVLNAVMQATVLAVCTYAPDADARMVLLGEMIKDTVSRIQASA